MTTSPRHLLLLALALPTLAAAEPAPAAAAAEAAPAVPAAVVGATADTWPSWRGNMGQTGVSPSTVAPKELVERWVATTGDAIVAGAVVDATHVYVGSKDGTVYAWNRADGTPAWKVVTAGAVEAPPLVAAGLVVIGSRDGHIRALKAASGDVAWDVDVKAEVTGGAAWVPPRDGLGASVLVGDYAGVLHRLDLATGAERWTYTTGSYLYGSAAVVGDHAVLGGCDGFIHTVALADGKPAHKLPVEAYVGASAAWSGDTAVVGHFGNKVVAFNPLSDAIAWTFSERSFAYLSSPAIVGDAVLVGGRDRVLHGIERATGEPLWWFPALGKVDSSPVVVGPVAFVGSHDGRLYAVDVDTGEEVRAIDLGAAISASPAVASGWVFVGAEDGTFHAFGPPAAPSRSRKKR